MTQLTWGRRLGNGALAGLGGGLASALLLWVLVEPAINKAIAIEEAGAADGHAHDAAAGASAHEHAEVVTRLQQQIGGTVTVVIVAVLLGLAYAVIYARASHRLPGSTDLGRSLGLAGVAFVVVALMPALVIPANPPAVGDPDTVNQRTLTYLLVILLSVLATGAVFALEKMLMGKAVPTEWRWFATAAAVGAGAALVLLAVPAVAQPIPAAVPAGLIWEFRTGSLAQLTGMWVVIGLVHGVLTHRVRFRRASVPSRAVRVSGRTV